MKRLHIRLALLIALIATLMPAAYGTLYAAGEQLQRATVLSAGGGGSSDGVTLMSGVGASVAGWESSSSGADICSGFLCAPALAPAACTEVASVQVNGPTVGTTGVAYNFSAAVSPETATAPLQYTWTPAPVSGQGTAAASIQFASTGAQVVSVTVNNCSDAASVNDGLAITINSSSSGDKPVTGVAISGPSSGSTNTDYTYTAVISPSDADTPVTYTWSPAPKSGQGTATAVYSFPTSGVKNISVTAQNASGGNSDVQSVNITSSSSSSGDTLYAPLLSR